METTMMTKCRDGTSSENNKLTSGNRKGKLVMKEKILEILAENYPEIDFESSDELVDDGTLDSLTVVGIISALSAEFDVELPYEEIIPENFNSVDAMAEVFEKYM